MREYEFEPVPGLPAELPTGEKILWQGAPQWRSLARRAFHTRKVAAYFAIVIAWDAGPALWSRTPPAEVIGSVVWTSALAAVALGILGLLAWLYARSTLYTITNRRIMMRYGVALPMIINIPFRTIEQADLKSYRDGTGDIPLALSGEDRVAYLALWPNARPWMFKKPQPMFRAIKDAENAADILADALVMVTTPTADDASHPIHARPATAEAQPDMTVAA